MKGRRWVWALLLIPVIAILLGLAVPSNDDFAAITQRGTLLSAEEIGTIADLHRATASVPNSPSARVRVWKLPDSPTDVIAFLKQHGYFTSGMSTSEIIENGKRRYSKLQDLIDFGLGSHAVIYEGTDVPVGSQCVLVVREPSGLMVGWRRFVGRLKRSFAR